MLQNTFIRLGSNISILNSISRYSWLVLIRANWLLNLPPTKIPAKAVRQIRDIFFSDVLVSFGALSV